MTIIKTTVSIVYWSTHDIYWTYLLRHFSCGCLSLSLDFIPLCAIAMLEFTPFSTCTWLILTRTKREEISHCHPNITRNSRDHKQSQYTNTRAESGNQSRSGGVGRKPPNPIRSDRSDVGSDRILQVFCRIGSDLSFLVSRRIIRIIRMILRYHSRTQSPSYARRDEGLWPNPKPDTIKTW
jgi:hypothetical protein